MDRRTVALGMAAVGAVAAAVTVVVARGHGGPSRKHRAVASYIESVDAIQQRMRVPLTNTIKAYREFSLHGTTTSVREQLVQSERTLRTVRRRVAAVYAPPQAVHLRVLLVRLVSQEVVVAQELAQLSVFMPRFSATLVRSRSAGARLVHALAAVKPPTPHQIHGKKQQVRAAQASFAALSDTAAADQAAAVEAYDAELEAALARLRKLDPPSPMRPSFRTQIRTFELTRSAGAALAAELRMKNRTRVAILGRQFTVATRTATAVTAQKAEIAAIRAYNRRVGVIGDVQGRVQTELARLQRLAG